MKDCHTTHELTGSRELPVVWGGKGAKEAPAAGDGRERPRRPSRHRRLLALRCHRRRRPPSILDSKTCSLGRAQEGGGAGENCSLSSPWGAAEDVYFSAIRDMSRQETNYIIYITFHQGAHLPPRVSPASWARRAAAHISCVLLNWQQPSSGRKKEETRAHSFRDNHPAALPPPRALARQIDGRLISSPRNDGQRRRLRVAADASGSPGRSGLVRAMGRSAMCCIALHSLGRRTPRRPQSPADASCLPAPVHLFPVAPAPRLLKVPADGFLGLPDLVDSPTAVLPDGEGRWTGQPPGHVHRLLA